jgi:hypothetical protein
VILALMPFYFMYLGESLYPIGLDFTAVCFNDKEALYATVSVENRTQRTHAIRELFIDATEASVSDSDVNVERYLIEVAKPIVFSGLKERVIIKPQETIRFQLRVILQKEEWAHFTQPLWVCSLSQFGGAERGVKTISSSDATIEFLH